MDNAGAGLIDWFTVIAQIINFLILIGLLKHFLYRPVLEAIDAREKRIAEQLNSAQQQAQAASAERQALAQAQAEFAQQRQTLLQQAQNDAQTARQQGLDAARAEISALRVQWQQALQAEQQQTQATLTQRTQQAVLDLARQVLAELADSDLEAQLVHTFCQHLKQLNVASLAELQAASALNVHSAFVLTAAQQQAIQQALQALGVQAHLQFSQQADLLSGVAIISSGHKLAWSVSDYLAEIENRLATLNAGVVQHEPTG